MSGLKWLEEERGITESSASAFGVTEADDGAIAFQYPKGVKLRYQRPDGTRSFAQPRGQILGLFQPQNLLKADVAFLVEGETDTMRLWQELNYNDVFGLPGVDTWKPEYAEQFKDYSEVYVILDNDDDYKVQAKVEKCWLEIRKALRAKAIRLVLPAEVNDVCEFFDIYDLDALRMLADRRKSGALWHYEAMDLSQPPRPPDWLVDELICKGDLCMMIGEPGVGKSWLSMSLAVAVAEGHSSWLGRLMDVRGQRVLYVDEENPEALIPLRLRKLGLTDEGIKNIRFLHRQGVRLDRRPELLLDEALDWNPDLIVLDSLTRLHTKEENNAGEMAELFNDGIVPLARETGATTLVLHHVTKGDSTSSFVRTRGSGDLTAAIDSGLDVRGADNAGNVSVVHYKSRWILEGSVLRAQIADTVDGGVRIITKERQDEWF